MNKAFAFAIGLLLTACDSSAPPAKHADPAAQDLPPQALPGGATTVIELNPQTDHNLHVLSHPAANLSQAERAQFAVGNSFFTRPWVGAPASAAARDGLGPLFNAAACQDCHVRDGRGHAPTGPEDPLVASLVRVATAQGAPSKTYGGQIQTLALPGLQPEARVRVEWQLSTEVLPDGTAVELRRPRLKLDRWAYGEPEALAAGLRVAPSMGGVGLLEAIPQSQIEAYAKDQARRWPALSGRPNRVPDRASGATAIGRFGWKAAQPSVRQQSLVAFVNDIGITSSLLPREACTEAQRSCRAQPSGGEPELEPAVEQAIVLYARHLALPARRDALRPEVHDGAVTFEAIGCAGCHRPSWQTGTHPQAPALSDQRIFPYTDLLLHDMGEGLADGIPEFEASGWEFRTAPLWGLQHAQWIGGPKAGFLHDGRARTLIEAILWHGGEAQKSRDAWAALDARRRREVLRFLASL